MSSPYSSRFQYLLEGTETTVFRETKGLVSVPAPDSFIEFDGVEYKVERVVLSLTDHEYTNPTSGGTDWRLDKLLYKIYVSET